MQDQASEDKPLPTGIGSGLVPPPAAEIAVATAGEPGLKRSPKPWIVGLSVAPFGLVAGFTITALPFLLTKSGVSVDRVATISATVMSPTFWAFLLNPLLDTGLTRRAYCWIMVSISAICVALALWELSIGHIGTMTALLLVGELSVVLYGAAGGGWTTEFVPESDRGAVGGWSNVANLGGGAAGALAVMALASRVPIPWIGIGLAVVIVLCALPLTVFPAAKASAFSVQQVFTSALRDTWKASKKRECLVGFALFLAPASSVAAINLFAGLGKDFHTDPALVIGITGGGCAISASIGALLGGRAAGRFPRGFVYLAGGIGAGICAITMALTPHTPIAFVIGVLTYNALAGVSYAAFTALGLQLVGHHSTVASTQLGLFAAATNGAIVYMTWLDGRGYRHFGVEGLLLTDGLVALSAAIPLLFFVRHQLRRARLVSSNPEVAE